MSLFEACPNGIYGSYFTKEDLKTCLEELYPDEKNVEAKDMECMKTDGHTSRMVTFTIANGVPRKYLLKLPTCTELVPGTRIDERDACEALIKDVHNREVIFYKDIAPAGPSLKIPPFLQGKRFVDGVLSAYSLMEIVSGQILRPHEDVGIEGTEAMLEQLALLHSISAHLDESKRKELSAKSATIYNMHSGILFDKRRMESVMTTLAEFVPEGAAIFEGVAKKVLPKITADSYFSISEETGINPVIVHGDIWKGNILWEKTECGKWRLTSIVDWQTWRFGNPGEDIAKLYTWSLSPEVRKTQWPRLQRFYYEKLLSFLDGRPVPFTYQQLDDCIRLSLPASAVIVLGYMPYNFSKDRKENESDEERERQKAILRENIHSVFEEILLNEENRK